MLNGKTAIVTGGVRGIGRAIALELARQGADVAVFYAGNQAAAEQTVAQLLETGVKAKAWQCDVSDFEASKRCVEEVAKELGPVQILINNAGITRDGLMLTMSEEDYDRVLDVNLKGAFHMMKHCYSQMMRKRWGRVVNITSVVGLMGNAGQANYAAAKAGLVGLTKSMARELAGRGVTCNAVAPGYIDTDMTGQLPEKAKEALMAQIPAKRIGRPEDVARAVAFLVSDESGYITGEVLRVDGGLAM